MDRLNSRGQNLAQFLQGYDASIYPRPSYTSDIILFYRHCNTTKILLVERGNHPYIGDWALPGGFVNSGETSESCANRELLEETGVKIDTLQQLYTVSTPNRDPRGWTISTVYYAAVPPDISVIAGDDAASAQWFCVDYTHDKNVYVLSLTSASAQISAKLQVERGANGKIDVNATKILSSNGIAFDHATLILFFLESL